MTAGVDPASPSDADLVAAVRAGDRAAFAAVYDRYGGKLYDFAYATTRHREDAADAVADTFVRFAERLGQLREPDRLRPWLYAITRNECLRRLKGRNRMLFDGDERLNEMVDDAATPESSAEHDALRDLVWAAAAGLADRDRAMLDLHLRQGLDGAELGEAMGMSAAHAYVQLNRLRSQVERSLGALLVARTGREECRELDALLTDWDGTLTPIIRKRVARHVENCEMCSSRKRRMVSPWALLATVPLVLAPAGLRDRVLEQAWPIAAAASGGGSAAGSASGSTTTGVKVLAIVSVIAAVVAVVLLGIAAASGFGAASHPVPIAPPTPSVTPTVAPSPGELALASDSIDLGFEAVTGSVDIVNVGESPLTVEVRSGQPWLTVEQPTLELGPGESATVVVHADRSGLAPGPATSVVELATDVGSWSFGVQLTQPQPLPQPQPPSVAAPTVVRIDCVGMLRTATVRVAASGEVPLSSVVLSWSSEEGPTGSAEMSASGGEWEVTIGPFSGPIPVDLSVRAVDQRGLATTGATTSTVLEPCS
jgi:RNA polymerase sigma factor (sigma-70 family)